MLTEGDFIGGGDHEFCIGVQLSEDAKIDDAGIANRQGMYAWANAVS